VLSVITDQKLPEEAAEVIVSYSAVIITATDYSPFGVGLYGRSWSGGYRYGFQGQEEDQEMWEGAVSYKYRVEDARLGRFFSVDPLHKEFPWNSSYGFSENSVIAFIELEGLEKVKFDYNKLEGTDRIALQLIHGAVINTKSYNRLLEVVERSGNKDVYIELRNLGAGFNEKTGFRNAGVGGHFLELLPEDVDDAIAKEASFTSWYVHDVKQSLEKGNSVFLIRIDMGYMKELSREISLGIENMNIDKACNIIEDAAHTILHEARAHAINAILGIVKSGPIEHSEYNHDKKVSTSSPAYSGTPLTGGTPATLDKIQVKQATAVIRDRLNALKEKSNNHED
jgi:RHS repeat-associated protein